MKKRILSIALTLAVIFAIVPAFTHHAEAALSRNVSVIATGASHTMAIKADGTLWGWGGNWTGQLGDGTFFDKHTPTQIGSDSNWVYVTTSKYLPDGKSENQGHTLAIKADGSLWAWGWNAYGQLGDGTTTDRHAPVRIGTGTNWVSVSAGVEHTTALRADGSLWAWGCNNLGQLGDGTTSDRHTPVRIGSGTSWASVSAEGYHALATRTDGSLWAWGWNNVGQLGDGTTVDRLSPVRVGVETDWRSVSASMIHSAAIMGDGSLWTWGSNWVGALGDGTSNNSSVPVRVGSDTNWANVSTGYIRTAAIKTDGSFWAWGNNAFGILGDGTGTSRNSPVRIGSDASWASVSPGYAHVTALRADGSLWAWGMNSYGQLGDGTRDDRHAHQMIWGPGSVSTEQSALSPTQPTTPQPPGGTNPSSWAQADVAAAINTGLVPQTLQSLYTQAMTRAEFCALVVTLYEMLRGDIVGRRTFSDTNDINVQKAAAIGVVDGVGGGRFSPNSQLTREQAATMLSRLANALGNPLPEQAATFSDNSAVVSWARSAVGQVQAAGIMGSTGSNRFSPKGSYTREQSIVTFLRMYNMFRAQAPQVNQPLDFRDWDVTDEQKYWAQNYLNELGNPTSGSIDVVGFELYYTDNGGLVLIAFIRNGMSQALNIRSFEPLTIKTMDGRVIATANFYGNYGTIQPTQSIIWRFNFSREFVMIQGADVSKYIVTSSVRH